MSQKTYFKILRWGVYASFLALLLVASNWLFPYSTLKQLYFNILLEALAVVWLALVIKYPAALPKKSWLTWGIVAWLAALLTSAIFGTDFNLSFWSDANRMLGWFHLAHFFIFYLIIITVFKTKQDWQILFNISIVASVLIVLYSLLKPAPEITSYKNVNLKNNIGTLGNATYVAGLMLVNFYFALLAILERKNIYGRAGYFLALFFILIGFFYADVSGSQAGLAVSLVVAGVLYALFSPHPKLRKWSLIGIGSFIIIISLLFTFRQAPIFNNQFGKIFRDFSFKNTNLNTRFYAWRAGWQGFKERPLIGWGYGNFGVVFDKFFDASYYRFTMTEEHFDRAHNNLIDLAATSGTVGLAAYLSIFVALAYYLIRAWRRRTISSEELIAAVAIVIAYSIHNLTVFDSFANYQMFFLALAWVYWLDKREAEEAIIADKKKLGNKEILVWLIGGAAAIFLIFNYNVKFGQAFSRIIKMTDLLYGQAPAEQVMAYYRQPFVLNTPMDRSSIITVLDHISSNADLIKNLSKEQKKELGDYYIELGKKNLSYNPDNSLNQVILGRFLMTICLEVRDAKYCHEGLKYVESSMAASPQHIPAYLIKQVIQLYLDDVDGAIATLNQALAVYDGYTDVHCHLARILLILKPDEASRNFGREHLKKCIAGGSEAMVSDPQFSLTDEIKKAKEELAIEAVQQEQAAKEGDYNTYLAQGLKYKGEGDLGNRDAYYKAIEAWQNAAQLSENKVWIPFLNIGNVYRILGDYDQAEANYNQALEISNGDAIVYQAKIELYQFFAQKSPEQVNALYQEALKKVVTDNANLMIGYAAFLRDNNYLEDALKAYQSLLKSFPDNAQYQQEITKLKTQLKK